MHASADPLTLSSLSDPTQASLPRRGEKDFEPNPTLYQADILSASRDAMHNALAHPRLHNPKARIIGIYAPDGPESGWSTTTSGSAKSATAAMHPDSCVCVPNPRGQYFRTAGKADSRGRVWLLPEEAVYLLERGSLDIRWPKSLTGEEGEGTSASEMPMSLQAAYASFMGRGGLAVERYSVYSGLRRLGYAVVRAPGWYAHVQEGEAATGMHRGLGTGLFAGFWRWFYSSNSTASGAVAGLGFHRSYSEWSYSLISRPY